jgi:hypothetical protein
MMGLCHRGNELSGFIKGQSIPRSAEWLLASQEVRNVDYQIPKWTSRIYRHRMWEWCIYVFCLSIIVMKSTVMPYSLERASRFGGTYRLHRQSWRVSQARSKLKRAAGVGLTWVALRPWRWRRYVPPKREALSELYGVTTLKTLVADMRSSMPQTRYQVGRL